MISQREKNPAMGIITNWHSCWINKVNYKKTLIYKSIKAKQLNIWQKWPVYKLSIALIIILKLCLNNLHVRTEYTFDLSMPNLV